MYQDSLPDSLKADKTLTAVIYGLYAGSFFIGITAIIAIILNYVKRGDMAGTFLESHFRWQMRTFWFGLLWTVIGTITTPIGIGWVILAIAAVWLIYRVVRGFLRLGDNQPMYSEASPAR